MTDQLQPIGPDEARCLYLDARKDECAKNTLEGQDYRIRAFVAWCEEQGIENLNTLDGRDLYAYRVWWREGNYNVDDDEEPTEIKTVTLRGDMATMRAFLRFCGEIDAVHGELFDQVPLPRVTSGQDVSDSTLDPDRARAIIDYLETYEFASCQHAIALLLWHTGCRTGALRALDVDDLDLDGSRPNADGPAVHFVHRPQKGTSLKNNEKSERWNTISAQTAYVLESYIDGPRIDSQDEFGRDPPGYVPTWADVPIGNSGGDLSYYAALLAR